MPLKPALNIRPKSILFATDLTPESQNAMRHALALARHYGATLHIAHVVSSVGFTVAGPDAIAVACDAARRDLQELDARLSWNGIKHDCVVRQGDIWAQIECLIDEDNVDMVVIGTHGRQGFGKLLLGSAAEKIIRCAPCPVITVGPSFTSSGVENARPPQPVIFATDFENASLQGLPYAVTFSLERKVKLILLHVIPSSNGKRNETDDGRQRAEEITRNHLHGLLRDYDVTSFDFDCVVKCGDPADEILKLATSARSDAIVLGLHRTVYPDAVSHFRQTIAYEVICRAQCAVFTARD